MPHILQEIRDHIEQSTPPVQVVFDLDDTLFDAGSRSLRILKKALADPSLHYHTFDLNKKVNKLSSGDMCFLMSETLDNLGVYDKDYINRIKDFWYQHFFTNEFCALDDVFPGSVEYVHSLHEKGASIVYLTGRSAHSMLTGTQEALTAKQLWFKDRCELILKPNSKILDIDFKREAIKELHSKAPIIAAFENEPPNINMMGEELPNATMVFMKTRHFPTEIKVNTPHIITNFIY